MGRRRRRPEAKPPVEESRAALNSGNAAPAQTTRETLPHAGEPRSGEAGQPVISVITIVRNCVSTLESTMKSVLGQTYPRVEYIVVDGGSTDGTAEIIRRYADRVARWCSEPDRGVSHALNKGAEFATGDLLIYMNAGDSFVDNEALQRAVEAISCAAVDLRRTIFYGDALFLEGARATRLEANHEMLGRDSALCHQSVLIGADIQKSHPYDERFAVAMDYDLWLRCLGRYEFVKVPVLISNFGAGGFSSSDKFIIRSVIERAIARILNNQRGFTISSIRELFRDLLVIGGKQKLKRSVGPGAYARLKGLIGR